MSDIHLGTPGCKAELLLEFLAAHDCGTLYLVGDIVDGWRMRRRVYWRPAHEAVIAEILRRAQAGTRVVYVPGNHDEALRPYAGLDFAGVEVRMEAVHEAADGRRYLVMHGDHFDGVVMYARWLAHLGDWAYAAALAANEGLAAVRRRFGMPYWSLSAWLKRTVKNAAQYIGKFEEAVAREAEARGLDGVVCGHIHHASLRRIGRVLYANDGDWVESCTALVEDETGALSIVDWAAARQEAAAEALAA